MPAKKPASEAVASRPDDRPASMRAAIIARSSWRNARELHRLRELERLQLLARDSDRNCAADARSARTAHRPIVWRAPFVSARLSPARSERREGDPGVTGLNVTRTGMLARPVSGGADDIARRCARPRRAQISATTYGHILRIDVARHRVAHDDPAEHLAFALALDPFGARANCTSRRSGSAGSACGRTRCSAAPSACLARQAFPERRAFRNRGRVAAWCTTRFSSSTPWRCRRSSRRRWSGTSRHRGSGAHRPAHAVAGRASIT